MAKTIVRTVLGLLVFSITVLLCLGVYVARGQVQGQVIAADTQRPIAGVSIKLNTYLSHREQPDLFISMGEKTTKTDENGFFKFKYVVTGIDNYYTFSGVSVRIGTYQNSNDSFKLTEAEPSYTTKIYLYPDTPEYYAKPENSIPGTPGVMTGLNKIIQELEQQIQETASPNPEHIKRLTKAKQLRQEFLDLNASEPLPQP